MPQPPEAQLAYLGFRLIDPSPPLYPYVRHYWVFRRDTPLLDTHDEYMHPRGGYGMVFNFGDDLRLNAQAITEPMFLDGSNTVSRTMGFRGVVDLLGVSFRAGGAFPFLAIPLAELQNATTLIDALDSPSLMPLYARLRDEQTLSGRIALLEQWLIDRLSLGKERHPIIPASLAMLRNAGEQLSIPALAQQIGIGERQLERLYQTQVGMSPKKYVQLQRVETARLALKQLTGQSAADLAVELGFYDQAHFIREFSAVVGMTPYRYMQRSLKNVTEED